MKQTIEKKSAKLNLAQAKQLAAEVYTNYKKLYQGLSEHADIREYIESNINGHSSLGDVYDQICLIESALTAKTDGRPQSLDFSASHGHSQDLIEKIGADGKICMMEENRRLREWAKCSSPGSKEKAVIGGLELSVEELARVRTWIDQVIEWHKAHPDKEKKA